MHVMSLALPGRVSSPGGRKRRRQAVLLLLMLLGLSTAGTLLVSQAGARNTAVTPFTLTAKTYDYTHEPNGKVVSQYTLARRSDGTTVLAVSLPDGPGADHLGANTIPLRTIKFLDGRTIQIFDPIRGVINWPRASGREVARRRARIFNTDSDCVEADEYVAGHTRVWGENVIILKMLPVGSSGVTSWRAPNLGCERLQYTKDSIQANGSIKTLVAEKLVSFRVGAPRVSLFYVPKTYAKLIPSQALKQEMKLRGVRWDEALAGRAQSEDADYYRMMGEALRSKDGKK